MGHLYRTTERNNDLTGTKPGTEGRDRVAITADDVDIIAAEVERRVGVRQQATKKPRRNWEKRLVAEYVGMTYGKSLQWRNVRLGEIVNQEAGKMYAFLRRWADAVVITTKEVIVIEGKIKPNPGVISQLQLYLSIFPRTPEYHNYRNWPIRGEIVCALRDTDVERMAREAGLDYVIYEPSFMKEILDNL
jgi:hypothetical protein